jgi:uncharacterized membrane protein YedE/YeeE
MHQLILSTIGGALIGGAAAVLLLLNGQIAGVSGIFANAVTGARGAWRYAFLLGLLAAAIVGLVAGLPGMHPALAGPIWIYPVGGALVGAGTWIGSGCTSGHGVCGLSNLSPRSLTATVLFMATAGITVFLVRHVL